MDVKVLGPGCAKCKKLFAEAEKAIAGLGAPVTLTKIEKIEAIMAYGVLSTPALVINEQVKSSGRVIPADEILAWLRQAQA